MTDKQVHTGETGALYSQRVARAAFGIINRLSISNKTEFCEAILGLLRLAEVDPTHQLTKNVVRVKLEAFKVDREDIERFAFLVETDSLTELIQFHHPTLGDSKYVYEFKGF